MLRIFEVGHALEALAIRWLRMAGFDLRTFDEEGQQFGFAVVDGRIAGHCDGIVVAAPAELKLSGPMLWECKTMADKHWRDCANRGVAIAKPVYAAQLALYQAYLHEAWPGLADNPALFTAINKDTQELWFELVPFDGSLAQRMSDRGVRVVQATEAQELLPRGFAERTHFECRFCAYQERCWGGGNTPCVRRKRCCPAGPANAWCSCRRTTSPRVGTRQMLFRKALTSPHFWSAVNVM